MLRIAIARALKTGKELVVGWNDDLRAWVQECRAAHGKVVQLGSALRAAGKRPLPLLRGRGRALNYNTIARDWRLACAAARVEDAHLHDGRAFSATEAKRQGHDPQKLLGHEDARTTKTYLRGREIEVVQGPSIRRPIDRTA